MPDGMGRALEQGDSLYLQQRYTDRRFNISTRLNSRSQRAPFHLTCTFPVRLAYFQVPNVYAMHLRFANPSLWQFVQPTRTP